MSKGIAIRFFIYMNKLLTAGKELIRGNFDMVVKSLSGGLSGISDVVDVSTTVKPALDWFFGSNGIDYHFQYGGLRSSLIAYDFCPPVNAIINRKAQAYINGKTWILNSQNKVSNSPEAKRIRALMARPNALQSWKQFEAQGYIYQQIFGYNIVLPIKPNGFTDNTEATSMWNIPPSMVDIEETNKLFYQTDTKGIIKQIVLSYKDTRTVLNVADIFIMKDFTPSFTSLVIPNSRIKALTLPVNNIIGAYESRNVLINYRGALGILSNDPAGGGSQFGSLPIKEEDKQTLQNDLSRYGLKYRQWQFIVTSATLKWQQMGVPTKDLMLFEEIESDTQAICDSYNYPFRLLSSNKSNSLGGTDATTFLKQLYQDGIIPEAENIYEQWNHFFNLDRFNLHLDKDFSHVAVLQEDKVNEGRARWYLNQALLIEYQNDMLTWNQWQQALGNDTVPGMDLYYSDLAKIGRVFTGTNGAAQLNILNDTNGTQQNTGTAA